MSEEHNAGSYYVPKPSYWPITGSIALLLMLLGIITWLHQHYTAGPLLFISGFLIFIFMLFGWFGTLIKESRAGFLDNPQVIRSFRWGFAWFILSEFTLFFTLFGVLLYARVISVPQLGGGSSLLNYSILTHVLLWPNFQDQWPVYNTPNPGLFLGPKSVVATWGGPAWNTLIILLSGVSLTAAYWGVLKNWRPLMTLGVMLTIIAGILFLILQVSEYWVNYTVRDLTLKSGIYGSTFYFLTAVDGLHVLIGVIFLFVIMWRMFRGDFSSRDHFGFAAVYWYWSFVELMWLAVFIFVYWA